MRVLVTGATGLLGSELVRQLVEEGARVRVLIRKTSPLELLDDVSDDVEQVIGDVTDAGSVLAAMEGVDHVYHAAGYIGLGGKRDKAKLHAVNVQGTANVVNAALRRNVARVVHTSSMAAFGRPEHPDGLIDEQLPWTPSKFNSAYASSKHQAELEIHRGIAEGLDAVMVNPSLIFGVARQGENTRSIVEKVRAERFPGIPSGGTNVVDVRDVARGHRLAMLNGGVGERYFLGGENLSWEEILQTLARAFEVDPPRFHVPDWLAIAVAATMEAYSVLTRRPAVITRESARTSTRFYRYSNEKAIQQLGWSARPFAETAHYIAERLGAA